jgi:hypothetical protein
MAFGLVTEVDEGTEFSSRRGLYDAGIHRALVGRQASGAEAELSRGCHIRTLCEALDDVEKCMGLITRRLAH